MKQEIYQNGFYLMLGILICVISSTLFNSCHSNNSEQPATVVVHDTISVKDTVSQKPTAKIAPLNDENLKRELANNGIKHSNIVFAQAKLESANYQSSLTKTHNNIFGMRKGNRYRRYNNWQECVKDYKDCIQSRYTGGDYYTFLDKIGYAEDPNYIKKLKQII